MAIKHYLVGDRMEFTSAQWNEPVPEVWPGSEDAVAT